MDMIGRGTLSLRKADVLEGSRNAMSVGYKKIRFAHKCTGGETEIVFASLNFPAELSTVMPGNPSQTQLESCQLRFFSTNLTLTSSARGLLIPDLSYECQNSKIVLKGFTAYPGEIFYGLVDYVSSANTLFVDAKPINVSKTMGAAETIFNVGEAFQVNAYPGQSSGSVKVFRNRQLMYRNTGNSSSLLDKDYYEVPSTDGFGTTIKFNTAYGALVEVTVVSNYAYVDRPDFHLMQKLDVLATQLSSLATMTGHSLDLTSFPNTMDLKAFGDRLLFNEARILTNGALGDVQESTLTEAQFQAERDATWILGDGRSIVGSHLHQLTGLTNAPDFRGVFRRGKNNGRADAYADPDGERVIGSVQADATARPTTPFTGTTTGSGSHNHTVNNANYGDSGSDNPSNTNTFATELPGAGTNRTNTLGSSPGGDHTHGISITGGGDLETRPNNVAVNVFIKINRN